MSIELLLLSSVGQIDQSPGDDPGPAVEEELEVEPLSDARIKLDAHHKVVKDVSCKFAAKTRINQSVTPSNKIQITTL